MQPSSYFHVWLDLKNLKLEEIIRYGKKRRNDEHFILTMETFCTFIYILNFVYMLHDPCNTSTYMFTSMYSYRMVKLRTAVLLFSISLLVAAKKHKKHESEDSVSKSGGDSSTPVFHLFRCFLITTLCV